MWAKIKAWFYKLIGRKSKGDEVFGLEVFDESGDLRFSANTTTALLVMVEGVTLSLEAGQSATYDFSQYGSKAIMLAAKGAGGGRGAEVHINGAVVTFKQVFGTYGSPPTVLYIGILR